ncbi:MAG: class I tRNA ligase family protein, partial [Thermoplasmata archaeon]|nr:class I tRNA ligase family protein [Thermoplasmata archaeon]
MQSGPDQYESEAIEQATRRFWNERGLPPSSGSIGPLSGPRIHQIVGTVSSDKDWLALLQSGVAADADARFFAQSGRRTVGRILLGGAPLVGPAPPPGELLTRVGVWIGAGKIDTPDPIADSVRLQPLLDRLAVAGILIRRETPLRSCPRCRVPRTPAGIVYHEEEGPAYLVRFPLTGATPPASLIVWTDVVWKLLGAPAILAQPDALYITLIYRRRGTEERIIVSKSSLERLKTWLPGSEFEVVEEFAGTSLAGRAYDHPLGTESPMLGRPPAPSGQVHVSAEVTESGTGLVALVPAHGAADAAASRALDLPGWPVLDGDLSLTSSFRHKYQGLPVDAGEAFVLRDLRENGYLFAQLTVRRGVPHCAICGSPLVWETGSAWCLDPSQLPTDRLDLHHRLLPTEPAPPSTEVVPWPVSEREPVEALDAPQLRECTECRRLAPATGAPKCTCGGATRPRRRHLLPVFRDALLAWERASPFPPGEAVRLYLPSRRRAPTILHHLVAMEATQARPGDLRAIFLPTLPPPDDPDGPEKGAPIDAFRATLIGMAAAPRGGQAALRDRRAQEVLRLRRVWALARLIAAGLEPDTYAERARPIATRLAELLEEDRALLSTFERARREAIRQYESSAHAAAQATLERFFDGPLRSEYLPAALRRLGASGTSPSRSGVFTVLAHLLPCWAELYAPIAPFSMEAVTRLFRSDNQSVFERPLTPILEQALDPKLEKRWENWWSVVEATRRARQHLRIGDGLALSRVVLNVTDQARADALRQDSAVIARLANVHQLEVASPAAPWGGRRLEVTPVLPAIQKVFGSGAPRVARILQGLPTERVRDGVRSRTLEVAVEGRPVQVTAAMVDIVERLPEGYLTFPWQLGELLVEVPESARGGGPGRLPALSVDAYRLVHRLRQRVKSSDRVEGVKVVVICATGPLGEELLRQAPVLAIWLGVPIFRVVSSTEGFPLSETTSGKTGRGEPWSLWVPGTRRAPARAKNRSRQAMLERVRRAADRDTPLDPATEFLSEPGVRRDTEIDRWVVRLDELVGRPLVGPAKLRAAWESGIQRFEDLTNAPFDQLAAVPGFGAIVATELVLRFGGVAPSRPSRAPVALDPPRPQVATPLPSNGSAELPVAETVAAPIPPSIPHEIKIGLTEDALEPIAIRDLGQPLEVVQPTPEPSGDTTSAPTPPPVPENEVDLATSLTEPEPPSPAATPIEPTAVPAAGLTEPEPPNPAATPIEPTAVPAAGLNEPEPPSPGATPIEPTAVPAAGRTEPEPPGTAATLIEPTALPAAETPPEPVASEAESIPLSGEGSHLDASAASMPESRPPPEVPLPRPEFVGSPSSPVSDGEHMSTAELLSPSGGEGGTAEDERSPATLPAEEAPPPLPPTSEAVPAMEVTPAPLIDTIPEADGPRDQSTVGVRADEPSRQNESLTAPQTVTTAESESIPGTPFESLPREAEGVPDSPPRADQELPLSVGAETPPTRLEELSDPISPLSTGDASLIAASADVPLAPNQSSSVSEPPPLEVNEELSAPVVRADPPTT